MFIVVTTVYGERCIGFGWLSTPPVYTSRYTEARCMGLDRAVKCYYVYSVPTQA